MLVVDCYPGIRDVEVLAEIERVWKPNLTIDTTCIFYPGDELTRLMTSVPVSLEMVFLKLTGRKLRD